jgi:hypothetical protein
MYHEIGEFIWNVGFDKRLWKDGEFWTAATLGVGAFVWFRTDITVIIDIRSHFGDLLSVTSIVFGFILTTLFFYIQAAGTWSNEPRVKTVAEALVDHHVWTVVSHLVLIGYILLLWVFGRPTWWNPKVLAVSYGALVFLVAYCGFQILNNILTVRWSFMRRQTLLTPVEQDATQAKLSAPEQDATKS